MVIALPSQLVKAYNIKHGDFLEIVPFNQTTLLLRKNAGPKISEGGHE
jgi:hypothetical protein